eukprot:TRINITY_DN7174_c0_g1_i1.p1 TRINITY_DN7174_c0_g1~~TRINITY_DN7174_c0_g1_i1.p1  ORF type:complete len:461 (-),score=92.40 TRINITY_DN7174_c0_g1_i1:101-1483(-)
MLSRLITTKISNIRNIKNLNIKQNYSLKKDYYQTNKLERERKKINNVFNPRVVVMYGIENEENYKRGLEIIEDFKDMGYKGNLMTVNKSKNNKYDLNLNRFNRFKDIKKPIDLVVILTNKYKLINEGISDSVSAKVKGITFGVRDHEENMELERKFLSNINVGEIFPVDYSDYAFHFRSKYENLRYIINNEDKILDIEPNPENTMINSQKETEKLEDSSNSQVKKRGTKFLPNVYTYNTKINYYAKSNNLKKVDKYFNLLMNDTKVQPDKYTYDTIINFCTRSNNSKKAGEYFDFLKNDTNVQPSIKTYNTMIKCARLKNSEKVEEYYNLLKNDTNVKPDVYTYNSMINYSVNNFKKAEEYFNLLKNDSNDQPDKYTYNSMIKCCARCKNSEKIEEYFSMMKNDPNVQLDIITYNTMINYYIKSKNKKRAEEYINLMKKDSVQPNEYTDPIIMKLQKLKN